MCPDLVRTERLDADGEREGKRVPGLASYYRFDQRTRHGGVGDPRPATAEKGELHVVLMPKRFFSHTIPWRFEICPIENSLTDFQRKLDD